MLEKYEKKRNFENTTEPFPEIKSSKGDLVFVVQKHKASHLHYDLRLELGGVLKSWAVPKGPSLDPNDKRLAVMVEDHPLNYKNFEGIIPEGNYGAGTVMIWDEGSYQALGANNRTESEKLLSEGLAKGHITFVLSGKKLCGEFALVRLKRAGENSWLLIKAAKDDCATDFDITKEDKSVKTGRTLEEITESATKEGEFWGPNRKNENSSSLSFRSLSRNRINSKEEIDLSATVEMTIRDKGKKAPLPHNIKPMMATLVKEPFDDKDWIFEIKWDGYRAITEISHSSLGVIPGRKPGISSSNSIVRIYSRNNKDFNARFPEIVNVFQSYDKDVVFDGEIVAVDDAGKPSFQLLQDYLMNSRSRHSRENGNLVYYIFDVLHYDGYDLTQLSLKERREILRQIIPKVPNIQFSEEISEKGIEFFEVAKAQDLEGIMAKNVNSSYQAGKRGKDWLKIKNHLEQEVVIGGFTAPKGSRADFGSIAVGVYEKGKLIYIGNVGTGFNDQLLTTLKEKFEPLVVKEPLFSNPPKLKDITWLNPEIVAEVKFQEWTSEGSMRQPVFLGLREDKKSEEVHKELPR